MQGWDERCFKAEDLKVCVPIILPLLLLLAAEERDIESSTQLSVANRAERGKELEEYLKGMQGIHLPRDLPKYRMHTTSSTPVDAYAFILRYNMGSTKWDWGLIMKVFSLYCRNSEQHHSAAF